MSPEQEPSLEVPEPQPGDFLAHYRIVEKVGIGGMGTVYKAHEPALDRLVGIKVLHFQMASDPQFTSDFLREAQAVAKLNHPNVVHIYYVAQQGGFLFFAMEFVDGYSIYDMLMDKKIVPEKQMLGWARQSAVGLQHAQQHNIIHRDVKPANIMITRDGVVKITDFGLAKFLSRLQNQSLPEDAIGTPEYMSPEQAQGHPNDHRSDIYSLGATIYHAMAGRPPFISNNPLEVVRQQINVPAPPIQRFNPAISPVTGRILAKCLAKQPGARYQTYKELIRDLDSALRATISSPAQLQSAATLTKPKSQMIPIVVAVAVVAVVGLGWLLWPKGGGREGQAQTFFTQLKQQADLQVDAERYGDAIRYYDGWPPAYNSTKASGLVAAERQRILHAAQGAWDRRRAEAERLISTGRYDDAIKLCDRAIEIYGVADLVNSAKAERDRATSSKNKH